MRSRLELLLEIEGNVAELLLDVTDDFTLGSSAEGVTTLRQVLDEQIREVTTGKVETEDSVWERETLVDGHCVRDTITGVEDDTRCTTGGVQRQDGLDSDVERWRVEGLEHDLGHLFTVGLGVKGGLREKDRVLLWCNTELVVEGVMPDLLHVIPVSDNTVLDGVFQGQDTTFRLGLITGGYDERGTYGGTGSLTRRRSPSDPCQPSHPDDEGDRRWTCGCLLAHHHSESVAIDLREHGTGGIVTYDRHSKRILRVIKSNQAYQQLWGQQISEDRDESEGGYVQPALHMPEPLSITYAIAEGEISTIHAFSEVVYIREQRPRPPL